MHCPHCRRDINPPDPSYRECATCGGAHRMMDVCPEKPTFFRLIGMWLDGDRSSETLVAFGGTLLLLFSILLGVLVAVQG